MKFLIIDNYDSFVYNIAQLLGELNVESNVIRNDKITIEDIKKGNYDAKPFFVSKELAAKSVCPAMNGNSFSYRFSREIQRIFN